MLICKVILNGDICEQPLIMGKNETKPPYIVAEKLGRKERETIDGDNEKKICNNVIIM